MLDPASDRGTSSGSRDLSRILPWSVPALVHQHRAVVSARGEQPRLMVVEEVESIDMSCSQVLVAETLGLVLVTVTTFLPATTSWPVYV